MITHPLVGAAGFEPATSWSQTRRDDRTTLRPDFDQIRFYNISISHRSPSHCCGGSEIRTRGTVTRTTV